VGRRVARRVLLEAEFCHTTRRARPSLLPAVSTPSDTAVRRYVPKNDEAAVKLRDVPAAEPAPVREIGGRKNGPEPTRYGDWEKQGRCIDF